MAKSRKPTNSIAFSAQGRNGMDAFSYYKFREFYRNVSYPDLTPDYGVHGDGFGEDGTEPLPIDFWYDKPYFGRYDLGANPIYLLERYLRQLPIKGSDESVFAVNFVADAFRDLQKHFSQALASKKLNTDFALSTLPVTQAHMSPDGLHQVYVNKLFDVFVTSYLEGNNLHKTINNFSDFVNHFNDFMRNFGKDMPFTFSSFIGSKRCPANICGLMLDMQPSGFSDDKKKVNEFFKKDDFSFYISSAKNHGFLVDKNVPWRLVADISSPKMKEYMKKYDPNLNKDNLFKTYYAKANIADIEIMMKNIISFYNNYVTSRPYNGKTYHAYHAGEVGSTKETMKTITRNRRRQQTSLKKVFRTYGIDDIMNFYFTIKCYETNAEAALRDKDNIMIAASDRRKTLGPAFALTYLSNKIADQVKINLTIGTEYVKGNNEKAQSLLYARKPQDKEPRIKDVISGDYSRK